MEVKDIEDCEAFAKYLSAAFFSICLCVIIKRNWFTSRTNQEPRTETTAMVNDLTKEFREMKKAFEDGMLQIAHRAQLDKSELARTVSDLVSQVTAHMEQKTVSLCQNLSLALDMEHLQNDRHFGKLTTVLDALREEVKAALRVKGGEEGITHPPRARPDSGKSSRQTPSKRTAVVKCDAYVQTELEMAKKRTRDPNVVREHSSGGEGESARSVLALVKRSLAELTSDARAALSRGADDDRRDLQRIEVLLTEDRQDIKNEILRAFTATAEQDQKNFAQFSRIGKEAMRYMTLLSENATQALVGRVVQVEGAVKEVLDVMNRQVHHMLSVAEHLNDSRKEFDEIINKIEFSYKNVNEMKLEANEQIGNIVNNLNDRDKKLDGLIKSLDQETTEISNILRSIIDNTNMSNVTIQEETSHSTSLSEVNVSNQIDSSQLNTSCDLLKCLNEDLRLCCNKLGRMVKLIMRCNSSLESIFKRLDKKTGQTDVMFELITGKLHIANDLVTAVTKDASKINNSLMDRERESCQMEELITKINKCSNVIFSFIQNIEEVSERTCTFISRQGLNISGDTNPKGHSVQKPEHVDISPNGTESEVVPFRDHKFMRNVIDQILQEAHNVTGEKEHDGHHTSSEPPFGDSETQVDGPVDNSFGSNLMDDLSTLESQTGDLEANAQLWGNLYEEQLMAEASNISLVSNLTDSD